MKIILLSLFLIPTLAFAQTGDTLITYRKVLHADSLAKDAIYQKVKAWAVAAFESTKGVIQVDDKESGFLAFDASTSAISPAAPKVDENDKKNIYKLAPFYHQYIFKFNIQIRDGRYKVEVTDIYVHNNIDKHRLTSSDEAPYKITFSKKSKTDEEWRDVKMTFDDFITKFIKSLDAYVSRKEDW